MKTEKEQLNYIKQFALDRKEELFEQIINERTSYVTVVLEDMFQSHNQGAVMRTADCMGIQHVHIIEKKNKYDETSSVSRGARDWLTLHKYNAKGKNNTLEAIRELKSQGYRIVATLPHSKNVLLPDLDVTKGKMAFFFGTEFTGLSQDVINAADEYVKVPMFGFTESLNVSVCAATILYDVTQRLRRSSVNWHMDETEKNHVMLSWYKNCVKAADEILAHFEEMK